MNLPSLSVKRGVAFAMVYLVVVAFGLYSLSKLKLDLFPDMTFPTVIVITTYEGASPHDIETLITDPIEGVVASVERVEEIGSESRQGLSMVEISFAWDTDMDQAETDVRRSLDLVEGYLPDDAEAPIVFVMDPAMKPVMQLALSGPYSQDELRRIADDQVAPRLDRLDGVANSLVGGGLEREIHVYLDPDRLEAYGLDPRAIRQTVYLENTQQPGGSVDEGALTFTVHSQGQYQTLDELGGVMVGIAPTITGAQPIRLRYVATIEDGFVEDAQRIEVDGEPAVVLVIRKQSGENTVQTIRAVEEALPEIEEAAGVSLEILSSDAEYIEDSIGNLASTALIAVAIAFVVLLLFLRDPKAAAVVSAAIPLSLLAAFALMDQADMTLNILSTAGLALAVGMLVDNAVVVLESIVRLRQQGLAAWDAAIEGAKQVGTAVTASTLTTLAVFVPILFVPGFAGMLFQDMAITICFALGVSLLVALSFVPLASSRLLGGKSSVSAGVKADNGLFGRFRDGYGHILDWTLAHRWVVVVGLVGTLVITGALASRLNTAFVASGDDSMLSVQVEVPIGTSLDETYVRSTEVLQQVEAIVPAGERTHSLLSVGGGSGIAALFTGGNNEGSLEVSLMPIRDRDRSQGDIERAVRAALRLVPGAEIQVGPVFNPMGGEGDLTVELRGHDLGVARELGEDLRGQLLAMPEVSEVTSSLQDQAPQVKIIYDRAKLAELGLSVAQVSGVVSTAFQGDGAGEYLDGVDDSNIVVRYDPAYRKDIDELRRLPVVTSTGNVVRLDSVATVEEGLAPASINRLDQARSSTLTVYLADEYVDAGGRAVKKNLGGSIVAIEGVLAAAQMPEGFEYSIGGSADDFTESFAYLGLALLAAVFLVYAVMAGQFESLRQPLIIIFAVPLALIGVVWALVLTGTALDVSALIGVIMLVGIVVNNGIVMVDAANQLRHQGRDRLQAIAQASRLRLRPVLLTSLTTILCMVPLASGIGAGSEQWMGMARAVIGGLSVATAMTLFVVPAMYTWFAHKDAPKSQQQDDAHPEAA